MRKSLLAVFSVLICSVSALFATDYTYGDNNNTLSAILPLTTSSSTYTSISQQLFLASDLTGIEAVAGDITALTFYYGGKSNNTAVRAVTRNIEIYISAVSPSFTEFEINSSNHRFKFVDPGTKVYDGAFTTEAITAGQVKTKKITFSNSFAWDGTKNIVITMFDKTNTKFYSTADYSDVNLRFSLIQVEPARFIHIHQITESSDEFSTYKSSLVNKEGETYSSPSTDEGQQTSHHWVNRITFSITPAAVVIPVPTNLRTTSVSTTSARLLWDEVTGATGYNVQWGTNSGSLDHSASNVSNTYLDIDELQDGTTYYFAVQTIKDAETSSYSDPANFNTTAITITYKGIVFNKWNSTSELPSEAGSYYLNADVALSAQYTLPGNINLCLNGNDIYTETKNIVVPDEKTLALYDNIGGGRIYGYYIANMSTGYGLISVENGGTFVLGEGAVENLYGYYVDPEDPSQSDDPNASYAICINNGGTFKLSGSPTLSAAKACIYLLTMYPRITIESGKPLTNRSAYSVDASGQTITSGWANMSGADPNVYLVSAKSGYKGIILNGGEAKFVQLSDLDLSLSESSDDNESGLAEQLGNDVSLAITRSPLTNAQYNTICLPYAMSDAEMQLRFGEDYDLEEFVSSSFDGDLLSLNFNQVTSLVAGKPYLLKPSLNAPSLSYVSVNIGAGSPDDQTSDANISFHGTFVRTELEGNNKNLLFLGADNELFWPEATGYLKAFRAYFEVKPGSPARRAIRACINTRNTPTGIENQKLQITNQKFLKDGQLLIIRDNKTYNVLGIECK